ncbi:MAG: hypothetical protein HY897_04370 [Deltaproteobacteria bacterium]|nr:hypothetical protein [Deltaproteobacteria bacterium]
MTTSLQYGVMSKYTSFLVLESEEQYKEYKVGRLREAEKTERADSLKTVLKKSGDSLQAVLAVKEGAGTTGPAGANTERSPADIFKRSATKSIRVEGREAEVLAMELPGLSEKVAGLQATETREPKPSSMRDLAESEAANDVDILPDSAGRIAEKAEPNISELRDAKTLDKKPNRQLRQSGLLSTGLGQARDWELEMIAEMEARKSRLSMDERIELLTRYLSKGLKAKADAWTREMAASFKRLEPVEASVQLHKLVSSATAPDVFKHADSLAKAWMAAHPSLEQQYAMLTTEPRLKAHLPARVFDAACGRVLKGETAAGVVDACIGAAAATKRETSIADRVLELCEGADEDNEKCLDWMSKLSGDDKVRKRLAVLLKKPLNALKKAREQDVGNPELIVKHANMLIQTGELQAALRMLSEIVEFAPQDRGARQRYARELVAIKHPVAGCAQLATVAQLDSSERDVFKEMMSLRRAEADIAADVRSCIVDGVSKLPVERAISLVLAWEDPRADIDLHVFEAGGEEVFFSHRESRNGGFLYYDIITGYGPEIYTLGTGPKGSYRPSVVYYGGDAPEVKGTLTILREAGTPRETREDRPFLLRRTAGKAPVPLGEVQL